MREHINGLNLLNCISVLRDIRKISCKCFRVAGNVYNLWRRQLYYGVEEILLANRLLVVAGCDEGCLVADIRNVSTGETRRVLGEEFNVKVVRKPNPLEVDLENFSSLLKIRKIDVNLTVETSGTEQRLVEDVRTVGCREYDDTGIGVESVHLGKQLVQSVLAFVI